MVFITTTTTVIKAQQEEKKCAARTELLKAWNFEADSSKSHLKKNKKNILWCRQPWAAPPYPDSFIELLPVGIETPKLGPVSRAGRDERLQSGDVSLAVFQFFLNDLSGKKPEN